MSQLIDFLKTKTKKNANYNIDTLDIKNTSYEDIISNYDLHDEDVELGRAIYNKEVQFNRANAIKDSALEQATQNKTLGLENIQRAQSQAQQGVQNQYSLRTKYQNYLNQQQGLDSSVAGTVANDLSLRSKLLSQMGAINSNALNNTQQVNQNFANTQREISQNYDDITRDVITNYDNTRSEIASRYEAQRQSNYENLMADTTGAGDNLQNIETYDSTYKYDSFEDIGIAQTDYNSAKAWLDDQKAKGSLSASKISELETKLASWKNKIDAANTPQYLGTKSKTVGMGTTTVSVYQIGGKKYEFTSKQAVNGSSIGVSASDVPVGQSRVIFKNGKNYIVTHSAIPKELQAIYGSSSAITAYEIK